MSKDIYTIIVLKDNKVVHNRKYKQCLIDLQRQVVPQFKIGECLPYDQKVVKGSKTITIQASHETV